MNDLFDQKLQTPGAVRERRMVAMHLQALEGNPFDAEQVAMFEMFERLGWTLEQRRAYLAARALPQAAE